MERGERFFIMYIFPFFVLLFFAYLSPNSYSFFINCPCPSWWTRIHMLLGTRIFIGLLIFRFLALQRRPQLVPRIIFFLSGLGRAFRFCLRVCVLVFSLFLFFIYSSSVSFVAVRISIMACDYES